MDSLNTQCDLKVCLQAAHRKRAKWEINCLLLRLLGRPRLESPASAALIGVMRVHSRSGQIRRFMSCNGPDLLIIVRVKYPGFTSLKSKMKLVQFQSGTI